MPDGGNGTEAEKPDFKVLCPACGKKVDRVDGEYARHYTGSESTENLCLMSRREIIAP
jgi:hypothetical protein